MSLSILQALVTYIYIYIMFLNRNMRAVAASATARFSVQTRARRQARTLGTLFHLFTRKYDVNDHYRFTGNDHRYNSPLRDAHRRSRRDPYRLTMSSITTKRRRLNE